MDNDSNSEDSIKECNICLCQIDKSLPYTMIDNDGEKGKYHPDCLKKWVKTNDHGLLTQSKIESYSIYQDNTLIETINRNSQPDTLDLYIDIESRMSQIHLIDETENLIDTNHDGKYSICGIRLTYQEHIFNIAIIIMVMIVFGTMIWIVKK